MIGTGTKARALALSSLPLTCFEVISGALLGGWLYADRIVFDTESYDFGQNSSSLRVEPLETNEIAATDGWSNKSRGFTFTSEGILLCEVKASD